MNLTAALTLAAALAVAGAGGRPATPVSTTAWLQWGGTTTWESRYAAPFNETCSQQLGPAPRAAPLVAGDRLITVSAGGLMNGFDRHTGTLQWTRDLLGGTPEADPDRPRWPARADRVHLW